MNEHTDEDTEFDDIGLGFHHATCQGCDDCAQVDDIGLCGTCAEKLDRDLIRTRDWAYSASAFACPPDQLEELRNQVIAKYGQKLELIAEPSHGKNRSKARKRKPKGKSKGKKC